MKKQNKKSQQEILVTILLILIALMAIAIVAISVYRMVIKVEYKITEEQCHNETSMQPLAPVCNYTSNQTAVIQTCYFRESFIDDSKGYNRIVSNQTITNEICEQKEVNQTYLENKPLSDNIIYDLAMLHYTVTKDNKFIKTWLDANCHCNQNQTYYGSGMFKPEMPCKIWKCNSYTVEKI